MHVTAGDGSHGVLNAILAHVAHGQSVTGIDHGLQNRRHISVVGIGQGLQLIIVQQGMILGIVHNEGVGKFVHRNSQIDLLIVVTGRRGPDNLDVDVELFLNVTDVTVVSSTFTFGIGLVRVHRHADRQDYGFFVSSERIDFGVLCGSKAERGSQKRQGEKESQNSFHVHVPFLMFFSYF